MKALSLWQPWGSLLVSGKKRVETRSWEIRHRGRLLIHAAKKWNNDLKAICMTEPFRTALQQIGMWEVVPPARFKIEMPMGALIGSVSVVGCYRTEIVGRPTRDVTIRSGFSIDATEEAFGDYSPNRFAFLCDDFHPFAKPYPFRGAQGLFDVDEEILELIEK